MPYIFLKETAAERWHPHAVLLLLYKNGGQNCIGVFSCRDYFMVWLIWIFAVCIGLEDTFLLDWAYWILNNVSYKLIIVDYVRI